MNAHCRDNINSARWMPNVLKYWYCRVNHAHCLYNINTTGWMPIVLTILMLPGECHCRKNIDTVGWIMPTVFTISVLLGESATVLTTLILPGKCPLCCRVNALSYQYRYCRVNALRLSSNAHCLFDINTVGWMPIVLTILSSNSGLCLIITLCSSCIWVHPTC